VVGGGTLTHAYPVKTGQPHSAYKIDNFFVTKIRERERCPQTPFCNKCFYSNFLYKQNFQKPLHNGVRGEAFFLWLKNYQPALTG
jgi:hypothetical protein